jgi:hypothetical protein
MAARYDRFRRLGAFDEAPPAAEAPAEAAREVQEASDPTTDQNPA